jgi:hypothetical protein
LTGHKGERRNLPVALVTDDFALYHRLVPFLESHGVPVLGVRPGEAVPNSVRALVGGPADDPRSVVLHEDPEATLLAVFTHLDRRDGRAGYRSVTFGVDPGKVIGLAVIADGHWLLVAEARSIADAVARLATWRLGLAAERWEIHVGDGFPAQGRELVAALRARQPETAVRLVPEAATTPGSVVSGSRHTDAAIHIAMRAPLD